MRFQLAIPDPSVLRVGKAGYVRLAAGTELHRIHPGIFEAARFNATGGGDARFSPIRDGAGAVIPTIYAAESFACAACEMILRCPDTPPTDPRTGLPVFQIVFPADFKDFCYSVVRTTVALDLVDLTVAGQRRLGVDHNALLAGPRSTYPATRGWVERIFAACPRAQGVYYNSVQFGPDFSVLLFGGRVGAEVLEPVGSRGVAEAGCHSAIRAIAESLSIDYADV